MYVVEDDKLIGSVSEGDIRRFLLNDNDIMRKAVEIMNAEPRSFLENQEKEIKEALETSELYSVPIVNFNKEIIGICFRNNVLKKRLLYLTISV